MRLRSVAAGLTDAEIAELLHIADRTVLRLRRELRIRAAVGVDKLLVAS